MYTEKYTDIRKSTQIYRIKVHIYTEQKYTDIQNRSKQIYRIKVTHIYRKVHRYTE